MFAFSKLSSSLKSKKSEEITTEATPKTFKDYFNFQPQANEQQFSQQQNAFRIAIPENPLMEMLEESLTGIGWSFLLGSVFGGGIGAATSFFKTSKLTDQIRLNKVLNSTLRVGNHVGSTAAGLTSLFYLVNTGSILVRQKKDMAGFAAAGSTVGLVWNLPSKSFRKCAIGAGVGSIAGLGYGFHKRSKGEIIPWYYRPKEKQNKTGIFGLLEN
ncbi:import inner membrane translocase subunit tim23-related [Anaeramoeba flamelloides]|uniref:Import inner membrane translocase subunit tim23-related n=1 Tax=Anaeramoeba flamelloides TaxID=1746091 RepID=A0AAV8AIB1_9EUKA|nr:import inner membrane translocase subunit tim23-related [Anaeramoeba flamelloides]|eukprot:Anaeramoba_flamelloidesa97821_126.p1 GENE.a97821_126~~a97821_126.p1  ORF type:complete len:214 (-),score=35.66 a97821_126:131-772(-)